MINKEQKIKIAFINYCMVDIDFSTIVESNPGIGGTEYLFLNIPYQLANNTNYDVIIYSKYNTKLENTSKMMCKKITTIEEAYQDAVDNNIDILVTREDMIPEKRIEGKTRLVLWLHLTHSYKETKDYADFFDYIIFVSKYELKRYCFNKVIRRKSTFIYNIPPKFVDYPTRSKAGGEIVCFIGSLNPGKGFASLTKIWPKIVKKRPNAKLIVIGSGNLYNPNQKLGKLGIAEESYENEIMQPLLETNTTSSVSFMGKMNTRQINATLENVDIGIVNLPTNIGETFCMTIFDFARMHIPIIGRRTGGVKEVIPSKNTFCYRNSNSLKRQIIYSLSNIEKRYKKSEECYNYLCNKFDSSSLINCWYTTINIIANDLYFKASVFTIIAKLSCYYFEKIKHGTKKIIYWAIKVKNKVLNIF